VGEVEEPESEVAQAGGERESLEGGDLEPGIEYTMSACKGRWGYLVNEGGTHINRGYRIGLSFRQCLRSMFQIHNETVNVWSHVLGSMLFIWLMFHVKDSTALERPRNFASRLAHQFPFSGNATQVCRAPNSSNGTNATNATGLTNGTCPGQTTFLSEQMAFISAAGQFAAAQQMLQLVEFKLPGLDRWREMVSENTHSVADMVRENTNTMADSVTQEGRRVQENIQEAMHKLDSSLEAIRSELKTVGTASMSGCVVCWAKLARRLASSRESLQDQLASIQEWLPTGEETQQHRFLLGLTPAEWRDYTSAEIKSLSLALHTGISAATRAVRHATGEVARVGGDLTAEVQHELKAEMNLLWDMAQTHEPIPLERWPIIVFLFSGVICLTTSASYHLFNCHSLHVANVLLLVDYAGIGVLICGSFVPPVYYGFYCDDFLRFSYLATIVAMSVTASAVGIYSGLNPSVFWRFMRVICYSSNALFAVVPCGHLAYRFFSGQPVWAPVLPYIAGMLGLYALGTVIYFYQFPEKYWPGTFDFIFSSHQLWHIIVFLAAFLHFFCSVGHFQWRLNNDCSAPPFPPSLSSFPPPLSSFPPPLSVPRPGPPVRPRAEKPERELLA